VRKADVSGVVRELKNELGPISNFIKSADALPDASLKLEAKKLGAEMALLAASAHWEAFLTDLITARCNRDSSVIGASAKAQIRKALVKEKANHLESFMEIPKNLTVEQVRGLLDPSGKNLSFESAQHLVDRVKGVLAPQDAQRFAALKPSDRSSIDAWRAVRNYAAHRSSMALKHMNNVLKDPALSTQLRRMNGEISSAGHYLWCRPKPKATRRIEYLLSEMERVAGLL
jgi:hypothetical protein